MNPLVTPTWLSARLQDPNTIILDAFATRRCHTPIDTFDDREANSQFP